MNKTLRIIGQIIPTLILAAIGIYLLFIDRKGDHYCFHLGSIILYLLLFILYLLFFSIALGITLYQLYTKKSPFNYLPLIITVIFVIIKFIILPDKESDLKTNYEKKYSISTKYEKNTLYLKNNEYLLTTETHHASCYNFGRFTISNDTIYFETDPNAINDLYLEEKYCIKGNGKILQSVKPDSNGVYTEFIREN